MIVKLRLVLVVVYFQEMKRIVLVIVVALVSVCLQAQSVNYIGVFPTIDHSGKLHNKWSYNAYVFGANKPYTSTELGINDEARFLAFYLETGLTYHFSEKLSFSNAYVYERQNPFKDYYRNENRLFQQFTLQLPITEKLKLKQRFRFDERFVQNRMTEKTNFTHRLRYLVGLSYDISEKLYAFGYSEVFFNTSNDFLYEENWSALQLGYNINDNNALEAGFLYVGWITNTETNAWLNHSFAQITWVSKLDFRKSK